MIGIKEIRTALEFFGPDAIRRALPAFDHEPRNEPCGCFMGEMEGFRWSRFALAAGFLHKARYDRVVEMCNEHPHGHALSQAYEGRAYVTRDQFKQMVIDWLAEKDATGIVRAAETGKHPEPSLMRRGPSEPAANG